MTISESLKKIDFLKNLPDLDMLSEGCEEVSYPKGTVLFEEGELGDKLIVITSGNVDVYKENRFIATRSIGEYLGEMSLLGNKTRSATVKANTDAKTIEIKGEVLHKLLSLNPEVYLPLVQTLARRLKEDLDLIDLDNLELKRQKVLNQRYSRLLDDTFNEIYILKPDTFQILKANSRAAKNLGFEQDEMRMLYFNKIFQDISRDELNEKLQDLISKKRVQVSFECQNKRKDGSFYPVEVHVQFFDTENPPLIYAIVEDISDKKAMENHIKKLAFYDPLTKLPNRNLIRDRLKIMLPRSERSNTKVAVITMNLDGFKKINDSLGHEAGDQYLTQVVSRFEGLLRKGDTFGRLGGDEFVILLSSLQDEYFPAKMAQRVIDIMKKPLEIKGKQFYSNFSIGIALYPDDGKDVDTLFKNSNIAMYQAKKEGGRSYHLYKPTMHDKIISRLVLEEELWNGITNKEFEMYYQPKVNLKTGKIEGLEALIRWKRPDGKNVSPGVFIPIAEESRLIHKIWEWTFRTVCSQIRKWNQTYGNVIQIGVNLSGRQFEKPDLVEKINNIITSSGVNPCGLEIEVTETAVMTNIQTAIYALEQLRGLGLYVSLDDFGSGYTSLGYLKKLPIDTLKIDQSFIRDCTNNKNMAIIQGIIAISQKMGFKTIAEGVETQKQRDFLEKLQCDQFQGFFCSKATSAEEIEKLIWPR